MSRTTTTERNRQTAGPTRPQDAEDLVGEVRNRYGKIAEGAGSCCGPAAEAAADAAADSVRLGYSQAELAGVPEGADLGLGCGAPIPLLAPAPGETVLDLGSGAGLDALLAARAVGPEGRVIGVDMTPEMLARARANAERAGVGWAEFREGRLEALPVEDGSVDAVTSNCVINLVPDKARVFAEIARVLRPGGRAVVADIVLDGELPAAVERDLLAYVGCVAGALEREAYFGAVEAAGLGAVEVLRDVDFLAAIGDDLPREVSELIERTGVRPAELAGIVRSVTFRAVKPPAS